MPGGDAMLCVLLKWRVTDVVADGVLYLADSPCPGDTRTSKQHQRPERSLKRPRGMLSPRSHHPSSLQCLALPGGQKGGTPREPVRHARGIAGAVARRNRNGHRGA